jgi:type II restriction/modification system DNA methylase subunit YeeA
MNKSKLKTYAPQARKDFIAAVMARANLLGISEKNGKLEIVPSEKKGDVTLIAGQAWPAKVHEQRERLIKRMQKVGAGETAEAIAYTWFNRFAALRFMEIHDYLGHGHRVLSSREGGLPEILTHATELAGVLPGLNAQQIADMKLAGNKDGELYRLLLVAQCNALSNAMPFLFERIDDESELLLPGNLERTDSVVAKLVEAIPEEDWNEVEVIGWLYQFYISEKKDEVIGKVVKSEDIPAATQLFTPNWIVQYLVQNSVGRLWLMANPSSSLKSQWPYYIEPAEQTPEVQAQLDALIKTRMDEDGGSLNPETITVLDPACGSGHILVEAYEVLKGIYLERGYQARAIPRLILEKNLFGLDIDDRAAQLAGFALLMKARADDRRLLETPVKLNVLSLQESAGMDIDEFASHLKPHGASRTVLGSLLDTFTHAKTFGSLIQIPKLLEDGLAGLEDGMAKAIDSGDVFAKAAAQDLVPLVQQAKILAMKFDAVVANPPYMGAKYYCQSLARLITQHYQSASADIYACFMLACLNLSKAFGLVTNINIPGWMMNSTFEPFRNKLFDQSAIVTLIHNGRGVFGSDFGSCAFTLINSPITELKGRYQRLFDDPATVQPNDVLAERFFNATEFEVSPAEFQCVEGVPLSYQARPTVRQAYRDLPPISAVAKACQGLSTSDDGLFVRQWHEVSTESTNVTGELDGSKWFPYNKGGVFRKWFGNLEHVINWECQGREIKACKPKSVIRNERFYFKPSVSWQDYTIGATSFRYYPRGFLFATNAHSAFVDEPSDLMNILCFSNSNALSALSEAISPGLHFNSGYFALIPFKADVAPNRVTEIAKQAIEIAKVDWENFERSWYFAQSPLMGDVAGGLICASYQAWVERGDNAVRDLKKLEEKNNRIFLQAYGLANEISPEVSIAQVTLTANSVYRYGEKTQESDRQRRFREDTAKELISYAIGCMMGRYSLDEPGLIYAHAGNVGFDATRYKTFPADTDGIIPVTDELWFEDDAANRIREFILAVWPASTIEENMAWLGESLGGQPVVDWESYFFAPFADETIRTYLAKKFFKDHLQTYKKRPIYWLFSSGKQGAFQALVYLHRYHEGTLARMRAEYVVPLTGKMHSRIEMLEKDKDAATSTAARNKIAKQIEVLKKKHVELLAYDEKLRHYADMRISIDLDDGVKVNYGKFGDLLAEVKAVTGGASDE